MGVGDTIDVTLPETATTGYVWQPEVDEKLLEIVGDERHADAEPRGAPGLRVIGFKAVGPGETEMRLVKRRAWQAEAGETFAVQLEITPGGDGEP